MLERVLSLMPIMSADRDWRVRRVTDSASEILRKAPAELVGRSITDLIGLDFGNLGQDDDGAFDVHCEAPMGDDAAGLPLRIRGALLPDEPGGVYAAFCLIDLSGERAADARARALNTQLHHVWRLNSLGEMAAILAHELNQPLAAAATYLHGVETDLAKVGLMGQSAARTASLAKMQILRTGEIIRRMRDLLGADSRALGTERISSMMDDLEPILQLLARDAGARFELAVDADDDEVSADRIQFQQAVANLVRNGVEAAAARPSPHVRVTGQRLANGCYRMRIEDNGPGIPGGSQAALPRALASAKPGGMGLGLSITRTIVEGHGGTLQHGSCDLGGAAFWFDLPPKGTDSP